MAMLNSTSLTERKCMSYTEIHHNLDWSAKGKDLLGKFQIRWQKYYKSLQLNALKALVSSRIQW